MIWYRPYAINDIKFLCKNNMLEHLAIEVIEIGKDYVRGTMPVDHRTVQPMSILHGGASVALAESLGSIAAWLTVDPEKFFTVGMEINANHLRPVTSGLVTGTASVIHLGKTTQVWGIEIVNKEGKKVCVSRITMAVVARS